MEEPNKTTELSKLQNATNPTKSRKRRNGMHNFRSLSLQKRNSLQSNVHRSILKRTNTRKIIQQIKENGTFSKETRTLVRIATQNHKVDDLHPEENDKDKIREIIEEEEEMDDSSYSDDESDNQSEVNESGIRKVTIEERMGVDLKNKEKFQEASQNSKNLFDLDGKFKFFWDHFQMLLIFYVAILAMYKISYIEDGVFPFWDNFDYFIDFLFFLDIIFTFFTPYFDKHNCIIVTSHKKIAWRYLKSDLIIDLISIFPFDLFLVSEKSEYSILLRISKVPKLSRILRTTRIIRTFKVGRKDTKLRMLVKILSSSNYIIKKIIPLLFITTLIGHIFACLWHFIAVADGSPDVWLERYGYSEESQFDRYVTSFYFTFTTMTTTGYGDITPATNSEFFLTLVFMFVGVIIHSLVFGSIFEAIEENRKEYDTINEKLNLLRNMKKVGC